MTDVDGPTPIEFCDARHAAEWERTAQARPGHKRHAHVLHAAVRKVLRPGGAYLVSDHYFGDGGLQNEHLYMTIAEQRAVLLGAGFSSVERVAAFGSMVMHSAT
jgi:predicted methyltransferase